MICSSVREHLLSTHKALGSIISIAEREKKDGKIKGFLLSPFQWCWSGYISFLSHHYCNPHLFKIAWKVWAVLRTPGLGKETQGCSKVSAPRRAPPVLLSHPGGRMAMMNVSLTLSLFPNSSVFKSYIPSIQLALNKYADAF
jgi:hypothetical protein